MGGFTALEHQGRIKDKFNIYVDLKYIQYLCCFVSSKGFENMQNFLAPIKLYLK